MKDYVRRDSKELAKFVVRISLKEPRERSEHQRRSAEFFAEKWNYRLDGSLMKFNLTGNMILAEDTVIERVKRGD